MPSLHGGKTSKANTHAHTHMLTYIASTIRERKNEESGTSEWGKS